MEPLERIVCLDTETTGLDPRLGHRVIEIAAVEIVRRQITGNSLQFFVDPEREIDAGATAVHGFTWDDLRGKPKFGAVVQDVMGFLAASRVIIHNASFDVAFLDHELARLRLPKIAERDFTVEDSLTLARQKFPGKRNSLDALCDRLGVDNSQRNLHGALLDARLLANVYLAMTRGQGSLEMSVADPQPMLAHTEESTFADGADLDLVPIQVSETSAIAHSELLVRLGQQSGVSVCW
jgi:DNA polymerase III subunit epsilon